MTSSTQGSPVASVGDVIAGKYRIEGTLGTGGMGIVYAATHLDLDRMVAVKVVRGDIAEHEGAVERLLLEAKLAARFRSEHVCRVLDVGTLATGAPYIVMEYLEGADLATLLNQQDSFDAPTAVDFMMETCEALAEAHTAQIVHRDLKPENLFVARLLDGTPSIKVLDFGISKQLGGQAPRDLTDRYTALGSPYYMAPEQMRSAKEADARADIWAVGAILFELLTGRQAFEGETLPEVCGAVMSTEPPRACDMRPEVPEALSSVIDRCLKKHPQERFQNVRELATALAPFGSERAASSLSRIERTLAGKDAEGDRFLKDGSGRFRIGVKAQVQTPRSDLVSTSVAPQISSNATTGSARATVSPERRTRALWVLTIFALALGAGGFLFVKRRAAEHLPIGAHPAAREPAHALATVEPKPEPERPPPVAASAPPAIVETPAPSASASALKVIAPRTPMPRLRGRVAAPPVATPPSSASAPLSPSQAVTKPTPVQAFDSSNFGPRR